MKGSFLFLLTAPSGAGKTTFCAALADQARAAGWDVAGVLCPPVFKNGEKVGILVQNLRTGETRLLAQRFPSPPETEASDKVQPANLPTFNLQPSNLQPSNSQPSNLPTFNLQLGRWLFSPASLAWGNEILANSLPADLFLVDELGPLELVRGEGWTNALEALRSRRYRLALVVIRPELVEAARGQLPVDRILPLAAQPSPAEQAHAVWRELAAGFGTINA